MPSLQLKTNQLLHTRRTLIARFGLRAWLKDAWIDLLTRRSLRRWIHETYGL